MEENRPIAHSLTIQMGEKEYDSNCPMGDLAAEQFALHHDKYNLLVCVREHGGWYLEFGLVNGKMAIVGTANDSASVTQERRQFWERVKLARWEHLPIIRR